MWGTLFVFILVIIIIIQLIGILTFFILGGVFFGYDWLNKATMVDMAKFTSICAGGMETLTGVFRVKMVFSGAF